jgi:S1-C subfamily serine protease/photosystem II stability/assembly factor-like uncharacterized protein
MFARLIGPATLAGLLLAVAATPGRSDQKTDVENLEKQIAELKKKLEDAKAKSPTPAVSTTLLPDALKKMQWRNVGPANMGGRVTALAVYDADPATFWVATASGGLLKTENNGITFTHQFDKEATVSIGDVAVCQTNPNLVWVGTGEANPRNSVSYGDGVYKSTDGGKTWTNMGLKKAFSIGKVLIHPSNPDVVFVGCLGRLYGSGGDRGIFQTTDGGKTWKQVLNIDDKTGIIDMTLDPNDPNTILAAGWERKRDEFDGFFGEAPVPDMYGPIVTHGAGGGIWKSADGGKTWKKINDPKSNNGNGLPTVKTGRVGFSFSNKTKGLVFAIVDAEKVGTGDAPKQVYMGIVGESVPDNGGAKLTEITVDGPAGKAGLKANDVVIKADGVKVDTYDSLVQTIQGKKPGDKLKLVVKRDDKEVDIEVTLAQRPGTETARPGRTGGAGGPGGGTRPVVGFRLAPGTGIKVGSVTADSPAAKAGIKESDEITAVNGKEVKSIEDYFAAIGEFKAGDKVKLTILRDGKKSDVEVTLAEPEAGAAGGRQGGAGGGGRAGGGAAGGPPGMLMPGIAPDMTNRETIKVGTVAKDSPAEKAGIKVGDIIEEVDGKPITGFRDLMSALRVGPREDNPRKAGDKIKVKVKQGDKTIEAELPLQEMQMAGMGGGNRGANPNKPYQLGLGGQQPNAVESQGKDGYQTGGVYKSTNGGETWTRINSLNPRPMYFSVIRVDPTDDNTLYVIGDVPVLWKSTDGGKTFRTGPSRGIHADGHALWINPKNGKHLIVGCDGGFYLSFDAGANWEHLNHFALGQFYHIAVDNRKPYRIYGGLQDNGSWGGPSRTLRSYGPINEDWVYVSGGDGFVCRVDPTDPDLVYTESQGGMINRRNFRTGDRGFIRPPGGQRAGGGGGSGSSAAPQEPPRFNWNTPFILSSHNPSIFYTASEFVWRSVKKGAELKKISPELTRSKAGSGTALSESPLNSDVLYAGTDDGFVWMTKDGGTTWTNVTENIKKAGLPGYRWVATLEASKDAPGRCYVCFDAHRSDDDKPYLFQTDDYGATWKAITSNLPAFGSTRCLREDIINPDVLYCGTEFGAYVSVDRGVSWNKLGGNLPTVAVHEFAQPTTASEVVIGTHGRSIWITDVAALRQMSAKTLKAKATLFAPATATRWRSQSGNESPYSSTDKKFVGVNPPLGANLEYLLTQPAKTVTVKVIDVTGKTVASFDRAEKTPGYHKIAWSMQSNRGFVPAGAYKVVLTVDETEFMQPLTVEMDPNAPKDVVAADGEELVPEAPVNPNKPVKVPAVIDD